jgi:hypothetical protein
MLFKMTGNELGISHFVYEALEDLEITSDDISIHSEFEILDKVLKWHGIIGYTSTILEAIKDIKRLRSSVG